MEQLIVSMSIGTLLLGLMLLSVYRNIGETYIALWAVSWLVYAVRLAAETPSLYQHPVGAFIAMMAGLLSGMLLAWGTLLFMQWRLRIWHGLAAAVFLVWFNVSFFAGNDFNRAVLPVFLFLAIVYVWTGISFLRNHHLSGIGRHFTGWGFIIWGLHKLDYPLLRDSELMAAWGFSASAVLQVMVALGMIMAFFHTTQDKLRKSLRAMESANAETLQLMQAAEQARQQAEASAHALSLSDARFRAAADAAQDAIILIDREGRVEVWNRAAERIFGYREAEAIGRDLHDLVVPARLLKRFEAGFKTFQQTGTGPVLGELLQMPALRQDGQEFECEFSIAAFLVGKEWHAIGIVRDIEERKRSEQHMQAQLDELRRFQRLSVGRELRIQELKDEVERYRTQLLERSS